MTREEAAKLLNLLKVFDAPKMSEAIRMAKEALREVDAMRAYLEEHRDCDSCRHANEYEAACCEADCECSRCGVECACKDCWSSSGWENWEWKGGANGK